MKVIQKQLRGSTDYGPPCNNTTITIIITTNDSRWLMNRCVMRVQQQLHTQKNN